MTKIQLGRFNRAVDLLYERENGASLRGLGKKHGISHVRVGKILVKARMTERVLDAVRQRQYENLRSMDDQFKK